MSEQGAKTARWDYANPEPDGSLYFFKEGRELSLEEAADYLNDLEDALIGDEDLPHYGALGALLTDWPRLYNRDADDDPDATADGLAELRTMLEAIRSAVLKIRRSRS